MKRIVVPFHSLDEQNEIDINVFDMKYVSLKDIAMMLDMTREYVNIRCRDSSKYVKGNHPFGRFVYIEKISEMFDLLKVDVDYQDYLEEFSNILKDIRDNPERLRGKRVREKTPDWVSRLEDALDMNKIEPIVKRLEKATATTALHNYMCTPDYQEAINAEVKRRVLVLKPTWEEDAKKKIEDRMEHEYAPVLREETKKRIEAEELQTYNMNTLKQVAALAASKAPYTGKTDEELARGINLDFL